MSLYFQNQMRNHKFKHIILSQDSELKIAYRTFHKAEFRPGILTEDELKN